MKPIRKNMMHQYQNLILRNIRSIFNAMRNLPRPRHSFPRLLVLFFCLSCATNYQFSMHAAILPAIWGSPLQRLSAGPASVEEFRQVMLFHLQLFAISYKTFNIPEILFAKMPVTRVFLLFQTITLYVRGS